MFCSSSEKIAVGFTIIGKVSVTTCASINKRGTDLFTKDIFKPDKVFNLLWDQKTTFKLQKRMVLLILMSKWDLNCYDFLPRNKRRQVTCFQELINILLF